MDTQSKDILEQLLKRLDKIENQQHKLDRVMERLDTLQNILERQNQKQNLLDEILVKMAIKPEQDEVVTSEQLQGAQQESIQSFCVIHSKEVSTIFPHKPTQPFQGSGNQTDDTLKSIDDRTVDTVQMCRQLISWSQKLEDKLSDNNMENMKTFLAEIRSVKDLVKGQTNSELIWLNNQMDKKLSHIDSVVRERYQQQTVCDVPKEMKTSLDTITATNKQFIIDLENTIRNSIVEVNEKSKEQSLSVNETVKSDLNKFREAVQSELQTNNKMFISESETQYCRIISAAKSAIEDIKQLIQTEGSNYSNYKDELENIHTLINSFIGNLQGNMATVVKEVESTKASMISGHATVYKYLGELTSDLKDYIYKTKREIFAVTEKEAQIVRDRIEGPLPSQGKYAFDFYVNNFKTLVRSDKSVESSPWHINELRTCVIGRVTMLKSGEMKVLLNHGRHPCEVGLQPRSSKLLKIKATICDICVKELLPVFVGGKTGYFDQTSIKWNGGWGHQVGVISCDELLRKGYGEKEGYLNGALLIRYEVEVL